MANKTATAQNQVEAHCFATAAPVRTAATTSRIALLEAAGPLSLVMSAKWVMPWRTRCALLVERAAIVS
jgi:hypothetical protein